MRFGIPYIAILIVGCILTVSLVFKDNTQYQDAYDTRASICSKNIENLPMTEAGGYQALYPTVGQYEEVQAEAFSDTTYATVLMNNTDRKCLVAHNAHRRVYPASMTKLMTAIVVCDAIESGEINLSDNVILKEEVYFDEWDAVQSDLSVGDSITVRNLLTGLLMHSYNDYCVILARHISGSVSEFAERMNQKALELGATGCHFMNPHGLDEDGHYVTAYDMCLIVSEAAKHEIIREIDSYTTYSYTFNDSMGNSHSDTVMPTNQFLLADLTLPSNIQILAWKTGTTDMAGNCLTMVTEIDGKEYSMFVSDSDSPEDLYDMYGRLFNMTK